MKEIVVLDGYTLNPGDLSWEGLKNLGRTTIYDRTPADLTFERLRNADIAIPNKVIIDASLMGRLPKLKCICVAATGYNNVDLPAAKALDIVVSNIVGYGTTAVAQHVFALLLELTNHVGLHNDSVQKGEWTTSSDWCYWKAPIVELAGKTMGIYGMGRIGQEVARIARAFRLRVIAHDRFPKGDQVSGIEFVSLERLFTESDVLTLHAPLTAENPGVVNQSTLSLMKPSSLLINTSRGGLVNEADLMEALKQGRIAGAGIDVLSVEPPSSTNQLLGLPNCITTPHQAWASQESRQRLMDILIGNVKAFIEGHPINVVPELRKD